jgi:tetratricopeptide (TPR) repeat protein
MWRRLWALGAVLWSSLAASGGGAAPGWLRLDTPSLTVIGRVGERELREVAAEFERFREALAQLQPARATATIVPTVVIVFDSDRAFEPFRPLYRGKPVALDGMFVGSSEISYITLASRRRDVRPILHEYAHLMLANVTDDLPVWLNEGLAEYYSTFDLEDGRKAILGRPIESHLVKLQQSRLMRLDELLNVQHDSPHYNEGERRSIFYAQSWALVHYLLSGQPSRGDLLDKYMSAVEGGADAAEAWRRVFGNQPIAAGLKDYIDRSVFRIARLTLPERIEITAAVAGPLPDGDVEAFLGDLLYRQKRHDEAAASLERAAGRPDGARARTMLARLRVEQKRVADARALLAGSKTPSGDWLADYGFGVAVAEAFPLEKGILPREAAQAAAVARQGLRQTLAARTDLAHGWYVLAGLALGDGDLDTALTAIVRARALAPARLDYTVLHGDVLTRRRDYAGARNVLGQVLADRRAAAIHESVRTRLAFLGTAERAAAAAPEVEPPADDGRRIQVLRLREPQPGEERAAGMLTRVDCTRDGLAMRVRIRDETFQFRAGHYQDVEFVTYREELRGKIDCGPREPEDLVYITWRVSGNDRIVVAVEFLPKGYRLRGTR